MKKAVCWFVPFVIVCFSSCNDKTSPTQINDVVNLPVTANVPNSFTYTVNANQYTDNSQANLSFLSDSLVITLTSTSYASGQAIVSVKDSIGAAVFSDTVRSSKTTAIAHLRSTKPRTFSIVVNNLTARLTFTLVGE